jgi:hypothetical protein
MARPKRDVIAEFYNALDETGEYCDFQVGRYCPGMPAPEWTTFRHQDYDGAKAFARILEKRFNVEVDIGTSPNPPSSWTLFVAWLRLLLVGLRRRPPLQWRRLDKSWRPSPATRSPPAAVAWSLLTREETLRLAKLARSRGVALQAWLLWALKEAIVPELVPGSGLVSWHVPVSVHGAFPSQGETANCNFSLEVTFPADAGPDIVHQAIRQEMRLRRHWVVAKWVFSFGWMIPRWFFGRLVRLAAMMPPWQGSFSYSGGMAAEYADGEDEWYIGLNTVVKASPLGAGYVEWRERLALSIQIHPALATDPQVARDWIASWRRFAEGHEQPPRGEPGGAVKRGT